MKRLFLGLLLLVSQTANATPVTSSSGSQQLFIGDGTPVTVGSHSQTAVGENALAAAGGSLGIDETAFGAYALTSDTSGLENTSVGDHSLANLTNGSNNTALGSSAMANFNGYASTGLGVSACQDATGGSYDVCIGNSALDSLQTNGDDNVGIGRGAGFNITTGAQNVAIGYAGLGGVSTGQQNVAIGYGAGGSGITSGFGNTFIGATSTALGNYSYSTAIGYGAQIGASHQIILGTSSETAVIPGTLSINTAALPFIIGSGGFDSSGNLAVTGNLTVVGSVTCGSGCSGGGGGSPTSGPAFNAYGSTTGIADSTMTKATFATEEYDTDSNYSSSRFTPDVAGIYRVTAQLFYPSLPSSPSRVLMTIYKNGSEYHRGEDQEFIYQAGLVVATDVHLNGTTDYVEVYTYQNTGSTQSTSDNGGITSYFQASMSRAD